MTQLQKNGIKVVLFWVAYFILSQYAHGTIPFIIFSVITLLVNSVILAYVVSYFLIRCVDSCKISEHSAITQRYFFPALKVNLCRYLICFLIGAAISYLTESPNTKVIGFIFSNFIYSFFLVWIIEGMFEKGEIWKALRRPAAFGPLFVIFYFGISFLNIGFDLLVEKFVKQNTAMVFSIYSISAFSYLLFLKFLISRRSLYFNEGLDNLISKNVKNKEIEYNEKLEIKKGTKALVLGLFSLIPLVHFFAAYLGLMRFRKQKAGRIRALCGFIFGMFFTLIYLIMMSGFFVSRNRNKNHVTYVNTIERYLQSNTVSQELRTAWRYINNGDYDEAIPILEKASSIPDEIKTFALGIAYGDRGEIKKAVDSFLKCVQFEQHNGEAFFHLGVMSLSDEEYSEKAKDYFNAYLKRFPADKTALTYVGLIKNSIGWEKNVIVGIFSLIILWVSFSFHEFAHALAAYKCGDVLQKTSGRFTLNPFAHLDILGSVILPAVLIFKNSDIVFGWAKPVLVNSASFRNKEKDGAFVSFLGPFVNLLLVLSATVLLALLGLALLIIFPEMKTRNYFFPFGLTSFAGIPFPALWTYINIFLLQFITLNTTLFIFNLLPFPPLDGFSLFTHILPVRFKSKYEALCKYSTVILLILIATPVTDYLLGIPLSIYFVFLTNVVGGALALK